jgi:hypothetical protein
MLALVAVEITYSANKVWANDVVLVMDFIITLRVVEGFFKVSLECGVNHKRWRRPAIQLVYLDHSPGVSLRSYVINKEPTPIRSLNNSFIVGFYL